MQLKELLENAVFQQLGRRQTININKTVIL
jgi:hypothetical protein